MCSKLKKLTLLFWVITLFCCTSKKEAGTELKLISWNCDNFKLSLDTLHKASNFIKSLNADIICLQERPHTNLVSYDSIKNCYPQYKYKVINGREDENLNLAIFSKYPISNVKTWYFTDTYNKMMQADINWNNKSIRLFNVHLQTTGHGTNNLYNCIQRYKQSFLLQTEIDKSPYPVVLCGDFNDVGISYTIINLLGSVVDISWNLKGSYQKLGGQFKIDYILATHDWGKNDYTLFPINYSDHKLQYSAISLK